VRCRQTYTSDENNPNFPSYPDTVDMVYHQSVYETEELRSFCNGTIRSLRTDITLPRKAVGIEAMFKLLDNPQNKEDFHNYDYIDGRQGQWGRCRCELRIITGKECLPHFKADAEGKTPSSAQDHWAWLVDIAPRGKVCPVAKGVSKLVLGEPLPCNIMLNKNGPPSAWVLAQDEGAEEGTLPGRINDMTLSQKCLKCLDASQIEQETNRATLDQRPKTLYLNSPNPIIQPKIYKPTSGVSAHWSLEINKLYHMDDIRELKAVEGVGGVYADDLLVGDEGEGITYASLIAPGVAGPVFLP
jgi:hypothetical protein